MTPLFCLAAAIFFESRDQPLSGQQAVAEVVITRVESPRFPDTVCGVVFQKKQFSFTHDGLSDNFRKHTGNVFDRQAIDIAETIANSALKGDRLGGTSTHYHTTSVKPFWAKYYEVQGRIGDHIFYTAPAGK
tara:strand:- start:1083 stop:1478 length:396 start_codon:yes stop_codon:yes gene_type:complete